MPLPRRCTAALCTIANLARCCRGGQRGCLRDDAALPLDAMEFARSCADSAWDRHGRVFLLAAAAPCVLRILFFAVRPRSALASEIEGRDTFASSGRRNTNDARL